MALGFYCLSFIVSEWASEDGFEGAIFDAWRRRFADENNA